MCVGIIQTCPPCHSTRAREKGCRLKIKSPLHPRLGCRQKPQHPPQPQHSLDRVWRLLRLLRVLRQLRRITGPPVEVWIYELLRKITSGVSRNEQLTGFFLREVFFCLGIRQTGVWLSESQARLCDIVRGYTTRAEWSRRTGCAL